MITEEDVLDLLPPGEIPTDFTVYVAGNNNESALNQLKKRIDVLNRKKTWIIYKDRGITEIPKGISLIIPILGCKNDAAVEIRKRAKDAGIVISRPHAASSAKRILESISLKMFPAEPEVPAVEDVADVSQVALENVTPSVPLEQYVVRDTPEKTLPEVSPAVVEPVLSTDSSESVDLKVFDRVLSSMGDLETQLQLVSREISTLRAANAKLKLDKSALELEIQTSKTQLAISEKETERLTVENHSLSEENKRLRQELHSAQQIMDVVRKAMQPK